MRNLILTLCSFVVLTSAVQAKMTFDDTKSFQTARVLKIGRSSAKLSTNMTTLSETTANSSAVEYENPCLKAGYTQCTDCNYAATICRACDTGYFAYNTAAKPGCYDVCTGVTCRTGFSTSRDGNTCTCK